MYTKLHFFIVNFGRKAQHFKNSFRLLINALKINAKMDYLPKKLALILNLFRFLLNLTSNQYKLLKKYFLFD